MYLSKGFDEVRLLDRRSFAHTPREKLLGHLDEFRGENPFNSAGFLPNFLASGYPLDTFVALSIFRRTP
jgi:hypothetical protein